MKRLFVILVIVFGICLCSLGCAKIVGGSSPSQNDATPPPYMYPFSYDSMTDFKNAVDQKNQLCSELSSNGASSEMVEKFGMLIEKLQLQNMIVPYISGEVIELRNEEGFSGISLFASELYDQPWIFYYPEVSTGENFYIKITYVPDHIFETNQNPTASEVIKTLSPNSPNVNNLGTHHERIYNQTVRLGDREVTAMIIEYKNDKRNSTFLVYGDWLIEVKGSPEVWSAQWFSRLSFHAFNGEAFAGERTVVTSRDLSWGICVSVAVSVLAVVAGNENKKLR